MKPDKHVSLTVSIVEDDASTREILVDWIRRADGFRLVSDHESAESAIAALPKLNPAVALVDINLPKLTGIECVRRLKPQLPATQFVMLTVYEDADHIFEALAAGAIGYLLKETPRSELLAGLKLVEAGGSPMSSNIARKVVQSFRREPPPAEDAGLSPREQEVLELLARGYLYKEICQSLNVSMGSVNTFVRRIYEKLHVRSRGQAIAKYANLGPRETHGPGIRRS